MRKKSILFFIESLDGGGAEGALENIIANLDKSKYKITVVSETDNESRTQRIASMSNYRCFAHKNIKGSIIREFINRIIYKFSNSAKPSIVRSVLIRGKYDIEVAGCEGYATKIIANSKDKRSKKIVWVHTDFINNHWTEKEHVFIGGNAEEKECYERVDKIICVSQTIKDAFVSLYGMEEKIEVIYNIVDDEKIKKLGKEPINDTQANLNFIMAGSFLPVKGYERAVKVYAKLRDEGFVFSVIIMGIGYERYKVEKLLDELALRDFVTLLDYQPNPYKYMAAADAYVCASYAEGYSTTVTESVILGVPVITTDCSGMKEIFGDYECGIICENSDEGLFDALKVVLSNPKILEKYRENTAVRSKFFKKARLVKNTADFFETI